MLNASGEIVSQVMFTNLHTGSDIQDKAESSLEGKELYRWVQRDSRPPISSPADSSWRFESLPKGYTLRLHTQRASQSLQSRIEHFVLSDGLASLSVYVEKKRGDTSFRGGSRMGAVNAFGNEFNGFQITAVGEVPALTVKQVAQSLRAKSK